MIALNESVYQALVENGCIKNNYALEPLPYTWAAEMLSEGATASQVSKTVKIDSATAYTMARNEKLLNCSHPKHPEVIYRLKTRNYQLFTLVMVVPKFPVFWTHTLDPSAWHLGSQQQIRLCWEALRRFTNSQLLSIFSSDEIELIRDGDTRLWTWHHCMETGKLELVSSVLHRQCEHTGGDALWTAKNQWKKI